MRQAMLWDKLPDAVVQCHTCQWRCRIAPGKTGVCRVYQNRDGELFSLGYAAVSSVAADPIEKKPLFHFHPGTRVYSLGGWGCNFHCRGCQNWEISCPLADAAPWEGSREILPERAVALAEDDRCAGLAWTYNEPTMWFEYTLETARLAKEHNLYTVYVTNGYMTPQALDTIGPYLDAWRVDVKGFTDRLYRDIARIRGWRGILEVAERARKKWNMHVEVVTNVMPTMNDDAQLGDIARWIAGALGELTPWHVTRFYPQHHLLDLPATPVETIERAIELGKQAGLKFIYAGNIPGHSTESTVCYSCGNTVVRRFGYQTQVLGLDGTRCRFCGADLNFRAGRTGG